MGSAVDRRISLRSASCSLGLRLPDVLAAVDFVVGTDVEKNNFFVIQPKDYYDTVRISEADRVLVTVLSLQPVKAQLGHLRIGLELKKNVLEQTRQFRMPS